MEGNIQPRAQLGERGRNGLANLGDLPSGAEMLKAAEINGERWGGWD
jgi:hypothetical protein